MQAPFNSLPLLSVKSGLDSSLANISRELEEFFSSGGNDLHALKTALEELHRMGGVLRMLSLTGLVVFCSELEKLLQELGESQEVPQLRRDAIRRALFGLTHYLDALADGASNATLRLFHEYQELLQARGLEMAFDIDLFYPSLQVDLPDAVLAPPQMATPVIRTKAARRKYQMALLKWFRKEDPSDALRQMNEAIRNVMLCVPQNSQRGFWWAASGLIDCIAHDGIPPELNYKKSFSRIDRRMRATIEGTPYFEEVPLSEMLYMIARSHTVSDMVEAIKEVYALEAYLPEDMPLPPSEMAALLDNMGAQLRTAEEAWEHCVLDEAGACKRFAENMEQLHAQSEQLDRNTLQFLCKQMHAAAAQIEDPERAQRISMDMAMALLLLGSGITHYQHLGSGFHEQARILSARLQAGLMHMPEDVSKLASLISLYCQMEQREVMGPLATEMQGNLQHVEQSLNAFFNNAAKRSELTQINRLMSQVQGGMRILSLDIAEQLLGTLRQVTERYSQGATPSAAEMRAVAATISALEDYVGGLAHGQKPDPAALSAVLHDISELRESSGSEMPAVEEIAPVGVTVRSGSEDEELLEVFLEEARGVMETLRENLEISRLHMDSREPLVTMRRGFHTLKGSGRMVGLTELGEVAWAVERAMNKWLQENKPASPELLDMIGDAEVLFQHWVDMLISGNSNAVIDTTHLVTVADCIENGKPIPQPKIEARHPESESEPEPEPEPQAIEAVVPEAVISEPEPAESEEEGNIRIGSVSLSPVLFNIATEEAAQHVTALEDQHKVMHETDSHIVTYDFMRAAHTLAGVNRTMGFKQIADLAYALELWLEDRIDKPHAVNDQQIALIDRVVQRLDEMCAAVRELSEPQAQPELIAQLQADKASQAAEQTAAVAMPEPAAEIELAPLDFAEPEPAPAFVIEPMPEEMPPEVTASAQEEVEAQSAPQPRERSVHDEIDEQLLPIFMEEAHELYPQIGSTLRAWREKPEDEKLARNLKRSLHTLKGSARMAGAMRLGELTHRVEGRVEQAMDDARFDPALWAELDNYLDRIASSIEQLQHPQKDVAVPVRSSPSAEVQQQLETTQSMPVQKQNLEIGAERAMQSALLRVRSDTVDRLVNEAGEVSVARSRAETELGDFKNSVHELTESVHRLRKQLREIEIHAEGQMQARVNVSGESAEKFDPLEFDRFTRFQELTRFMNESVHDVQTVQQTLLKNLAETEAALSAQANLNRDLQQGLMAIRMVPFSSVSERLYRIVRQTGKELGKRANLELSGTEVELDRSVLEKMTAPFEHLLRNSIAHGLESPEQRELAHKAPIGEIRLALRQESNEVVFEFSDDGAGLDLQRIREKAIEKGVLQADEEVGDEQIMQLAFTSGISTAAEVTEISGRGVGMDVVRSEITALGGRIDVNSEAGLGVRFTIHLPLTLAVTKVLMVRAGHTVYALPSIMIENVQQLKPAALEAVYQQQYVDWQGKRYPMHHLSRLLGDDEAEVVSQPHNAVLLVHSGEHRVALHVEQLLGNQEAVVKNIGPQLARMPGIAGATVSGSGKVILILDPIAFTQRIGVTRHKVDKEEKAPVEEVRRVPVVMVVDDSLTVRKITGRLLARSGYQVVTAKDGLDALEQLGDMLPDVMLLDVEMPRMDGFELAKRMRQDKRTKDLPIIMITSRTAEKHRQFALELGVNEYMGKPFQEEELLEHIARFTAHIA
ncbi:MAG: Hpt domain-containing protein [Gammaproteobacteria bacterium]|nr:Hpt domain-containing protein [Gammaproteobacteria bacterium]MBU1777837.1 Hpt domain-containing protein [Gammaproteobacteria bacterium]